MSCYIRQKQFAQRLDLLEQQGIVTRTVHSFYPPRTSYALTKMGVELRPILEALRVWGENYMSGEVVEVD